MKYAFLHNNFQRLQIEYKVIFIANALTFVGCFLPWYSETPSYGNAVWNNVFGNHSFLIGWTIFLLSIAILAYFHDILWELKKIKIPFNVQWIFLGVSLQQILLIILAWSVLFSVGSIEYNAGPSFSIFLVFVAQFASLVSSFLLIRGNKKEVVKDFFDLPKTSKRHEKEEKESENTLL